MQRRSARSVEKALIRRLKREGHVTRSKHSNPLHQRIISALDCVDAERRAAMRRPALARPLRAGVFAALAISAAALLLLGLGLWPAALPTLTESARIEARPPVEAIASVSDANLEPGEAPDDLFSTPAEVVDSWTSLQASANPWNELSHDAQLAGQMALSTLPISATEAD